MIGFGRTRFEKALRRAGPFPFFGLRFAEFEV